MLSNSGAPGAAAPSDTAWLPHILLLLGIAMIAGYFVLGRAVHSDVPAIGAVFWRSLVGAAVIAVFFTPTLLRERRALVSHWRLLLLLGVLQGVSGHVCVLYGLQSTTAVNAGLIAATQPGLTALTAWIIMRDTLSTRQLAGLAIAVIGVLPIISRGDLNVLVALDLRTGDLLLQIAMISFGFYNTCVKQTANRLSPYAALFGILIGTTLATLPLLGWEVLFADQKMKFDWVTIGTIGYLAIVATVIALAFINIGIVRLGPARAGAYFFLMPPFTSLLAVVLLGEPFRGYHMVGLLLVSGGVYLVSLPQLPLPKIRR